MQNSVISTWIKRLYGFQSSPAVLCMQNSDFTTRITSICRWIDPTCGFRMQNSAFWTSVQVSMGTRPHLSFCACKSAWLAPELFVSMGPRHNLSFCACKTAWLAPELLVSMCPSPHLWFSHAKQRLLDQCTSLYGSQASSVVLSTHNSVLSPRIKRLYGFQPSPAVLCMQKQRIYD